MDGKIDTHHHFLPRAYVDTVGLDGLAAVMPNRKPPAWSEAAAVDVMDLHGIAKAILSISAGPPVPHAARTLRACNEEGAAIRERHPGRFGLFASLPLPDMTASLSELAYATETLGADGVILFTSYDGRYLGDDHFDPLLQELDRRGAIAFIHPNSPSQKPPGQPPESLLEFPFETTRTAASLILSGAMKRYSNIRFLLSHAGGALPFLGFRLDGMAMFNPELKERIGLPSDALRSFWFDTALSMTAPQLSALLACADPAKITFGSDFPMAPVPLIARADADLPRLAPDLATAEMIGFGNAERLLGGPG